MADSPSNVTYLTQDQLAKWLDVTASRRLFSGDGVSDEPGHSFEKDAKTGMFRGPGTLGFSYDAGTQTLLAGSWMRFTKLA
ncbi:MAG: hypothetical protein IT464_03285 [Planctomycetes bacterium]|nr:hypothetical protein [Planctomycetota bacterium]